jgi:hypothetical protein
MLKKKASFINVKDMVETKVKTSSTTDPTGGDDQTSGDGSGSQTPADSGSGSSTTDPTNTSGGGSTGGGEGDDGLDKG